MRPTICHLLVYLKALVYPFCIKNYVAFSLAAVTVPLHAAEMAIYLHLKWLFAFGRKMGGATKSLL